MCNIACLTVDLNLIPKKEKGKRKRRKEIETEGLLMYIHLVC